MTPAMWFFAGVACGIVGTLVAAFVYLAGSMYRGGG